MENLELRLERLKRLGNVQLQCLQSLHNGRAIIEAYANQGMVLHVHCLTGERTVCAMYRHSAERIRQSVKKSGATDGDSELHSQLTFQPYEVPVFVHVGQTLEHARPLASLVRLQSLNRYYMHGVDAIEEGLLPSSETVWRVFNRELCAAFGLPGVFLCQSIDEVIQGDPKVVNDLSRQDAPDIWWRGLGDDQFQLAQIFRILRVELDPERVTFRLDKGTSPGLQVIKVFLCPPDPKESTVELMGHRS